MKQNRFKDIIIYFLSACQITFYIMSVPDLIYGSLRALAIYEFYESLLTIYEVNMTVELYLKSRFVSMKPRKR